MKRILPLLLASAPVWAHEPPPPIPAPAPSAPSCWRAPDNWGGRDAHIGLSFALGASSALVFRDTPWYGQVGIAIIPGILKEFKDCRTSNLFSRKDLVSDLIGAGLGVGFANLGLSLSYRPSTNSVQMSYRKEF